MALDQAALLEVLDALETADVGNRVRTAAETSATARTARSGPRFLPSLRARGLGGVQLVISDAHTGLKQAISAVLLGAA